MWWRMGHLRPLVEAIEQDDAALGAQQAAEHALLGHGLAARVEHAEEVQLVAHLGPGRHQAPGHGLHGGFTLQ